MKAMTQPAHEPSMDDAHRATARLTRRALIAFVVIEAIFIFGSVGETLRRKFERAHTNRPASTQSR